MIWSHKERVRRRAIRVVDEWEKKYGPLEDRERIISEVMRVLDDGGKRFVVWLIGFMLAPAVIGLGLILWYEVFYRKSHMVDELHKIEVRIREGYKW